MNVNVINKGSKNGTYGYVVGAVNASQSKMDNCTVYNFAFNGDISSMANNGFYGYGGPNLVSKSNNKDLTPKITTMEGASIRIQDITGMRWKTKLNKTSYDALKEAGATVEIGTLIVPTAYIKDGNFTMEALDASEKTSDYLKVVATDGNWFDIDNDNYIIAGSLTEIMENHYMLSFSAVGYIKVTFVDGSVNTFYGGYSETNHARTVAEVAADALADENSGLSETDKAIISKFIPTTNENS